MTIDEKWEVVREHFQASYRVVFKQRPPDSKIEELYKNAVDLARSYREHLEQKNALNVVRLNKEKKHYQT